MTTTEIVPYNKLLVLVLAHAQLVSQLIVLHAFTQNKNKNRDTLKVVGFKAYQQIRMSKIGREFYNVIPIVNTAITLVLILVYLVLIHLSFLILYYLDV